MFNVHYIVFPSLVTDTDITNHCLSFGPSAYNVMVMAVVNTEHIRL